MFKVYNKETVIDDYGDLSGLFHPFSTNVSLLHPPENIRKPEVFSRYGSGTLVEMG